MPFELKAVHVALAAAAAGVGYLWWRSRQQGGPFYGRMPTESGFDVPGFPELGGGGGGGGGTVAGGGASTPVNVAVAKEAAKGGGPSYGGGDPLGPIDRGFTGDATPFADPGGGAGLAPIAPPRGGGVDPCMGAICVRPEPPAPPPSKSPILTALPKSVGDLNFGPQTTPKPSVSDLPKSLGDIFGTPKPAAAPPPVLYDKPSSAPSISTVSRGVATALNWTATPPAPAPATGASSPLAVKTAKGVVGLF